MSELNRAGLGEPGRLVGPYIIQLFDCLENLDLSQSHVSTTPPANANSPGEPGQMAVADNYLYVCYAPDKWGKTPFSINF